MSLIYYEQSHKWKNQPHHPNLHVTVRAGKGMEKNQYENLIAVAVTGGLIGLLVGIASGIIQQKYGSWGRFLRGMLAATVVAIFIALALDHTHLATTTKAAIVAATCYVADDVLMGLATLGKLFAGDPVGFIKRFANVPLPKGAPSDSEGNQK